MCRTSDSTEHVPLHLALQPVRPREHSFRGDEHNGRPQWADVETRPLAPGPRSCHILRLRPGGRGGGGLGQGQGPWVLTSSSHPSPSDGGQAVPGSPAQAQRPLAGPGSLQRVRQVRGLRWGKYRRRVGRGAVMCKLVAEGEVGLGGECGGRASRCRRKAFWGSGPQRGHRLALRSVFGMGSRRPPGLCLLITSFLSPSAPRELPNGSALSLLLPVTPLGRRGQPGYHLPWAGRAFPEPRSLCVAEPSAGWKRREPLGSKPPQSMGGPRPRGGPSRRAESRETGPALGVRSLRLQSPVCRGPSSFWAPVPDPPPGLARSPAKPFCSPLGNPGSRGLVCALTSRGQEPSGYLWPWAAEWLKQFMSSWREEAMPLASSMLRRGSAPRLSNRLTSS